MGGLEKLCCEREEQNIIKDTKKMSNSKDSHACISQDSS